MIGALIRERGTLAAHLQMRVLYDISTLGLAHLYQQSRGGAFRVDLHVTEALAASGECDLLFCANHSTVAYHGCREFLRDHVRLGDVPLLAPARRGGHSALHPMASAVHRGARRLFGSNVLPSAVRTLAVFVDRHLHPPVGDAGAPVDILHSPSTPLPPRTNGHGPRRFLTIYDVGPLRFTDMYVPAYRRSMLAATRSVQPDDRVITSSMFARDEICEFGIASGDRIDVVPLAADGALFYPCTDAERIAGVRRRYGIPDGPYVLSVNSPDPRKNVAVAIHAFARLAREGRDALGSLVLAGGAGAGSERIDQALKRYPELRSRIVCTGFVPDADLAPLYTGAQVFAFPSIYEGFGLPPLEAMQCGTPVIACNTSSLPEVVGDGGVLVPPGDVDALAGAMLDVARAPSRRQLQDRALAQARRFSWGRSTAETLRAYRAASAHSRASGTGAGPVSPSAAS